MGRNCRKAEPRDDQQGCIKLNLAWISMGRNAAACLEVAVAVGRLYCFSSQGKGGVVSRKLRHLRDCVSLGARQGKRLR